MTKVVIRPPERHAAITAAKASLVRKPPKLGLSAGQRSAIVRRAAPRRARAR